MNLQVDVLPLGEVVAKQSTSSLTWALLTCLTCVVFFLLFMFCRKVSFSVKSALLTSFLGALFSFGILMLLSNNASVPSNEKMVERVSSHYGITFFKTPDGKAPRMPLENQQVSDVFPVEFKNGDFKTCFLLVEKENYVLSCSNDFTPASHDKHEREHDDVKRESKR